MEKILDNHYESIVYISHPYGGRGENKEKVAKIIKKLTKEYPHHLFISPVHSFGYEYHDLDYQAGIDHCLWLLEKCDEMWVFGDWKNSKGCNMEVEYCVRQRIPFEIKSK